MNFNLLGTLGSVLGSAGDQLSKLVSCYARAGAGAPTDWNYTLVPFSTGAPIPAPVFFTGAAAGVSVSQAQGSITATVDLGMAASGKLSVTLDITIDKAKIASLVDPRLELVICPEQTVLFSGSAPARLSVIALTLGQGFADVPAHLKLKAELPITADGISTSATVSLLVEPVGVVVTAWLTDAPAVVRPAWFGTSVGTAGLPAPLKSTLTSLGIGLGGLLGTDPVLSLQQVNQALTVDTDKVSTGSRIDLDLGGTASAVQLGATVTAPWSPPLRPQVKAIAATPDPARSYRYLAAVLRPGSPPPNENESPPGAISDPVNAAVGSSVSVSAPPHPGVVAFAKWRLYRSRLTSGGWSMPVSVADVGAGESFPDTIPSDTALTQAETTDTPPVPSSLDLSWGSAGTVVNPAPLTLPVTVQTLDETLPNNSQPDSTLTLVGLKLPASGSASFYPNRGTVSPLTLAWQADATPLTVKFNQPRSNTDVHITLAPLPRVKAKAVLNPALLATVTWDATAATTITGHVRLPPALRAEDLVLQLPTQVSVALHSAPEKRLGYSVDVFQLGWLSNANSSLKANLAITNVLKNKTAGVAVVVSNLPTSVGAQLVLPITDDPEHPADPGKWAEDGEVNVAVGRWANAPALAQAATVTPGVANENASAIGQVLLRTGPGKVSLPGLGPGPGIAAALTALAGGGSRLDLRVDGLRSFALARPAGEAAAYEVRSSVSEAQSARVSLSSISTVPLDLPVTPTSRKHKRRSVVQVRARKVSSPLHIKVGMASVDRATGRYDAGDEGDRPAELTIKLHEDSAAVERLRVLADSWVIGQRPDSQTIASVEKVPPGSTLSLLPVPGTIDPINPGTLSWRKSGGMRVSAQVPDGGARLNFSQTATGGPPVVDVEATMPADVTLALGGDVGTLKAGSGASKIIDEDEDVSFPQDWNGRRIAWHKGSGTIASVSGNGLTLTGVPENAKAPDPDLPVVLRWYRVFDPPPVDLAGTPLPGVEAKSAGMRLNAKGSQLKARVGLVTPNNSPDTLRATTAGPKLRLEQLDDLQSTSRRGEIAAVAARVTARSALLSGWTGTQSWERLKGTMSPIAQGDVLTLQPATLDWIHAAISLDPGRGNRSLNVTSRVTSPGGKRDALRLRLRNTPDRPVILIGPGITEIVSEMSFGPGSLRAEPAQWVRAATSAEGGYLSAGIELFPPYVMLGSGWRVPELVNELDGGDFGATMSIGLLSVKKWQLPVTCIRARGGELRLSRVSNVGWSTVGLDSDGDSETPWAGSGDWAWGLSDIWFMRLNPNSGQTAEALIHTPGEPKPGGESDLQVNVTNGKLTARLFSVDLGEHPHMAGRRAAADASAFKHELKAEVQMDAVEGRFAIGPQVGLDWDPARPFQDDETSADSQWWIASYSYVFSWPVQFGSDGGFGQFDAPWDPYWS